MRAHVDTDGLVELTKALVAIDTRNPPGNEAPIEEVARQMLTRWEPTWASIEPEPGRLSLVAELPHPQGPKPGRPTLIVNGHLDVVPVNADAWTHDPFDAQVVDGRLYGRGSADMKGGIAAAVMALDTLERAGVTRGCDVVFHLVADEERGGRVGTKALLERGMIRGDACLVPEPTNLQLCVAERGLLQTYIHVEGTPAHGSRPRDGVSAVEHAARIAVALHAADYGGPEHQFLGQPTANVGTISGGSAFNVVAATATVGVDRRILPGATEESTEAELVRKIDEAGIDGVRYRFQTESFGEASEIAPDDPWVKLVGASVAKALGHDPAIIGMPFTTDARFMRNQAGIPAVVCGPGRVEVIHGDDEYVDVASLVDATVAYAELIAAFT